MKETILRIEAPCKINVHLRVKDRRPDGYHDLESIFVALAFGDTLWVERTEEAGGCTILMDWQALQTAGSVPAEGALPLEKNSVYRAVSLFRVKTGFTGGIRVRVKKRVPLGAGLGGGSSDAASMLRALQVLVAPNLSQQELLEMALTLGSDVPFFLRGGTAFVSGRGEQILPLKRVEGVWVVLVYPGFPSDTAGAFRLLDQARPEPSLEKEEGITDLIYALEKYPGSWPYRNDFLRVFLEAGNQEQAAVYQRIVQELKGWGADFVGLSGAGSTCFGIFSREGVAKEAGIALSGRKTASNQRYFVQVTFPLAYVVNEGVE
ncbi:MAG: 4-(cytidine 5'-diphospho)-2-C-methyl-D-erythritol kinase [Treponema sp.]|nr:4-(cytidine 5'-diphospho)-2-C-methyl-D-erythritol kinase [Treponema sp.]